MKTQFHIRALTGLLFLKISAGTVLLKYNELASQFYTQKTGNYILDQDPLNDLSEYEMVALCDEFINAAIYVNTSGPINRIWTTDELRGGGGGGLRVENYQKLMQKGEARSMEVDMKQQDISMEEADTTLHLQNNMKIRNNLVPPFKTFPCVKLLNNEWHLAYGLSKFVYFVLYKDVAMDNLSIWALMDSNPVRMVLGTPSENDIINVLGKMITEPPSICSLQSHIKYHLCGVVHDAIRKSWSIDIHHRESGGVLYWRNKGSEICKPKRIAQGSHPPQNYVDVPALTCSYDGAFTYWPKFLLSMKSIQGDITTVSVYSTPNSGDVYRSSADKIGEITVKSVLQYLW